MKEPRERVAEASTQSIKAGEQVIAQQPEALQSQKMAEAAAAVAWESQKTANKALLASKAAEVASESAYQAAMVNKKKLLTLKGRAMEASKNVEMVNNYAKNAEQQATAAMAEGKKLGPVL